MNKGRVKPERKLAQGDVIRIPPLRQGVVRTPSAPGKSLHTLLQSSILFENREVLVVNKPAGLAVHGGSGINLGLIEALRHIYGEKQFLELVHRLDRETSGCILLAKKRSALVYLQSQFREEKQVEKVYTALVRGRWPHRRRTVEIPLSKNVLQSGERVVRADMDGKASKTEFQVLEHFSDKATLVTARPITGRTHQIRVHACHTGHPLVGDEKYGDDLFNKSMKELGFKRLFLHASALRFTLPDKVRIGCEAPMPADLDAALENWREVLSEGISAPNQRPSQ